MTDHIPLPGTGSIADSVEFVKKLWGIPSAGALPGMLIPTLSLEEINKKITDLKAVESWMTVNMNMLRTTIQALEVQSATIVNLQSMGAMFGAPHIDAKTAQASGTPGFPFAFPEWPPAAAKDVKPEVKPEPVAAAPEVPEPALASVKKAAPPKGGNEEDRAHYAKARSYMVRIDDMVACRNIRCRKRFDLTGQTVVLTQEGGLPADEPE